MRWVTLFSESSNVHLTKDVGLVPYYLHLLHGVDATLVTYKREGEYPALEFEVKGLKLEFIENQGKLFFLEKAIINYLKKHAKQIDVLNLYHLTRDTIYYGNLFKKLHPTGKLYLKMDAFNTHIIGGKVYSKNKIKNKIFKRWEKRFLKNVELVSIENKGGLEILQKYYPELKDKAFYMPNGVHDINLNRQYPNIKSDKKENILLSVGRPGDYMKNYELLLQATPLLNLKDWKIVVIGPFTEEFEFKLEQFFKENPQLKDKLEFLGAINNRDEIYEWYNKSKAFFLPSRFESFGIAYAEALYFGNYLIGNTNMFAFQDMINNGEFGDFFESENPESLAASLQNVVDGKVDLDANFPASIIHSRQNFVWSILGEKLFKKIS